MSSTKSAQMDQQGSRPDSSLTSAKPHLVSLKTWIGVLSAIIGAFMAVLDTQITNGSIEDIQGALSATLEEASWISTANLIGEIIVIPLTGWLERVFSIRWYLLVNTALFVVFSICCAWAWNLPSMIIFRALQGFTGGTLIPLAFTLVLTQLPPVKQPLGTALFATTVSLAPAIGPTVGGWITENCGWEYIFYLNLIPGLLVLGGVWYGIAPQSPQFKLLNQGDWWGILSMGIGLASLQVVLEEGNRKDWFGSELIVQLSIVAAIFLTLFIWIEFTHKRPFINLRLLWRRNFGLASIVSVLLGLGTYGSLYLLPLYLAQVQQYNALQIGEVFMWLGIPQLFIHPQVPKLMQRFDVRLIVGVGMSLFAVSCFMNSAMTHDVGSEQLRWSQLVRAFGQPLIITPLFLIATAGIEKEQISSASALFNMLRNLGGSIGIAALATCLDWRKNFHYDRLTEVISLYNPQTQERLEQLSQLLISKGLDSYTAQSKAIAILAQTVRREAYVMAYNDCFYLVGMGLFLSVTAIIFLKKPHRVIGSKGS